MESDANIQLSPEDRARLEGWVAGRNTPQKLVWRARIVLMWAQGAGVTAIIRATDKTKRTAYRWRDRYIARGVAGLERDATRPGRKPPLAAAVIERVVIMTLHEKPPAGTHWSVRKLAKVVGLSPSSVQRIWAAHGLKPHLTKTFKLSNDKQFVEKVKDVVGLYFDPPDRALVFSVDEKSQIQALDRTQPGLPLKKGRAGTMPHDYKRNGTTTLLAALRMLDGSVVGQCLPRHRHQEFLKFLRHLDRQFPGDRDLHLIVDNYGTHTHGNVNAWLAAHPRFHRHFIPTSSSWLNLVERWFRELTDQAIRRGVFHSVPDLITAIEAFLAAHNDDPKPFVWTASVDAILKKVGRCKAVLETVH